MKPQTALDRADGRAPVSPDILHELLATPPRKTRTNLYERGMRAFALIAALCFGVALWAGGAYFTLQWLITTPLGAWVQALEWKAYLLPVAMTAVELTLNPRREKTPLLLVLWLGVLAFDALTTAVGVQRTLSLGGSTLLVPAIGAVGFAGVAIGVLLAYLPEKLCTIAIVKLWQLLKD